MKILAFETSCEHASIALHLDGRSVEHQLEGHTKHSEYILTAVSHLLGEAGLSVSALDAIAFGAGPGAFTGVRLACGVAQGLALSADIGVVPVPTLAALAHAASGETQHVYALTDARMGEIYAAGYRVGGEEPVELAAAVCMSPEAFSLPGEMDWWLVGSALKAWPMLAENVSNQRIAVGVAGGVAGVEADAVPRASTVAELAAVHAARGQILAPEQATPLYVRDKIALTTAERLARGGRA